LGYTERSNQKNIGACHAAEQKLAPEMMPWFIQKLSWTYNTGNCNVRTKVRTVALVASHDLQEPTRTAAGFVALSVPQYKDTMVEKDYKYLWYIKASSGRMK